MVDMGMAAEVFRGRAEGIRRTVLAPFGAAIESARSRLRSNSEVEIPFRASFHS